MYVLLIVERLLFTCAGVWATLSTIGLQCIPCGPPKNKDLLIQTMLWKATKILVTFLRNTVQQPGQNGQDTSQPAILSVVARKCTQACSVFLLSPKHSLEIAMEAVKRFDQKINKHQVGFVQILKLTPPTYNMVLSWVNGSWFFYQSKLSLTRITGIDFHLDDKF